MFFIPKHRVGCNNKRWERIVGSLETISIPCEELVNPGRHVSMMASSVLDNCSCYMISSVYNW